MIAAAVEVDSLAEAEEFLRLNLTAVELLEAGQANWALAEAAALLHSMVDLAANQTLEPIEAFLHSMEPVLS